MTPGRRKVGGIVKIDLGDGTRTYARVLPAASFAFYDARSTDDLPLQTVIERPILFFAAVINRAINSGRWPLVGYLALDDKIRRPPTFIQDPLRKDSFSIYEGGDIRSATKDQCAGLERMAVWSPEHIEDRLRDHYAGRKNRWLEALKIVE